MSKQEDFRQPEQSLEKTQEIDNEARISEKAEMKRKFSRKIQANNSVRLPAKLFNILDHNNILKYEQIKAKEKLKADINMILVSFQSEE